MKRILTRIGTTNRNILKCVISPYFFLFVVAAHREAPGAPEERPGVHHPPDPAGHGRHGRTEETETAEQQTPHLGDTEEI